MAVIHVAASASSHKSTIQKLVKHASAMRPFMSRLGRWGLTWQPAMRRLQWLQGTSELEQTDQAEGSKLPLEAGAEAGGVGKSQAGQNSQRRDAMQLGGSGMGQSAAAHGQGNAEAGSSEKKPASKRARLVYESGREVAKVGVYDELLEDFWKKFSEEEFRKFEMKQVKLDWKVHCVACKKDLAPGQPKYKLKNVEIQVEGQRKEGKMSEHMAVFGKAKEQLWRHSRQRAGRKT
jgi:hypothetical protein